ncbi:MAG: hypothetical protein Q7S31_02365 [bacterium]|nr:hypothetical protein [bacterium]
MGKLVELLANTLDIVQGKTTGNYVWLNEKSGAVQRVPGNLTLKTYRGRRLLKLSAGDDPVGIVLGMAQIHGAQAVHIGARVARDIIHGSINTAARLEADLALALAEEEETRLTTLPAVPILSYLTRQVGKMAKKR